MHGIISPLAFIVLTTRPVKFSFSVSFVVLKVALINDSVGLGDLGLALQNVVDEVAPDNAASWVLIHTVAFHPTLFEFASVTLARGPCHLARSLHLVVEPLAIVVGRTSKCHASMAHALA